ncbi:MAG: histidine--tRNA ligase [Dehalococcoidales bacterium]|nr:histidine--tRNA ligase [Dehalococcoidales bacterium]
MYRAPRGTVDILPEEQPYWYYVRQKADDICRLYGYERIDSPVFEDTGLFVRSVGQGTDIVEKEMYTFTDKGDNQITLRPEGTAPVCRAYLEHGMHNLPQPVKLFYLASIFRYERPQAGRLRQHNQFGAEAIGEEDPALDAEVIDMAWHFFLSLGLKQLTLQLNSIGCKQCRPAYISLLKQYYAARAEKLCPDCKMRFERNPLRLLDCKQPACLEMADAAPRSMDHLCPECSAHFEQLKTCLTALEIPYNLNHRLVRGLDYYTRTVFEFQPESGSAQSTIGGGGRYDNLIEELGGKPMPAIGFGTGIERIILNLKKQNVSVPPLARPRVFIAYADKEACNETTKLASRLRQAGIGCIAATGRRSLKAQLRQANSLGVRQAVIIGEEELKTGSVVLRDMENAGQATIPLSELVSALKKQT